MVQVNDFFLVILADITTYVAWTPYFCYLGSLGASYGNSEGIVSVPCCIIAASCIFTLLGAISKNR